MAGTSLEEEEDESARYTYKRLPGILHGTSRIAVTGVFDGCNQSIAECVQKGKG